MNSFFYVLLVIVVALDSFGFLYPEYFSRMLTSFLPMPVLIINYFNRVKKPNLIYAASFLFTYLGVTLYNIKDDLWFKLSLFSYSIGILIYVFLILEKVYLEKKHLIQFLVLLAIVLLYPLYILSFDLDMYLLLALLFYAICCLSLFYSTIILYLCAEKRSLALFSSVFLILSTLSSAFLLFADKSHKFIGVCSILFFWLYHVSMSFFFIKKDSKEAFVK